MKPLSERLQRASSQQLRCFEAAARLLSVTSAARELHVSQPTVSVQLRKLSELVGEPLFQAVGRRIQLTEAGAALQEAVAQVHACWQHFEARMGEIHGLVRGKLRIAAVTTAEYFVPDLLGTFAASHPGVDIDIAVQNKDQVVERLARGIDDLSVMMLPPLELPLQSLPFLENPLVVVAAPTHPRAGRRCGLRSVADERWLMREPGSGTRSVAEEHFAKAGVQPRIAMSLGSNEAIKHAVAAGLGIAVLSRLAVKTELASGRLAEIPVQGFPLRRRWHVVWRSDRPQTLAARTMVQHLRAAGRASAQGA
jgi:DNA-binding transcriptional LysR family regulator